MKEGRIVIGRHMPSNLLSQPQRVACSAHEAGGGRYRSGKEYENSRDDRRSDFKIRSTARSDPR